MPDSDVMLMLDRAQKAASKKNEVARDTLRNELEQLQLPFWADELRVAPNEVLRSALFSVNARGARKMYAREEIYSIGQGEIRYSGEELRISDEDVWLHIMHLVRNTKPAEPLSFSPHRFLLDIGWSATRPSKKDYSRLRECLERLNFSAVDFYSRRLKRGTSMSLIRKIEYGDDDSKNWKVWIEPEMRLLYEPAYTTRIEWDLRRKLTPIAAKLHSYLSTHKEPYAIKLSSFKAMSGSKCKELRKFRQNVRSALRELVESGFLTEGLVDKNDLISVKRAKRAVET